MYSDETNIKLVAVRITRSTHGCRKVQVGRRETNGVAPVMRRREQLQDGMSKRLNSIHAYRFTAPQPHIPPRCENAMARLTALQKPDGGVCGIATGDAFRRLVARARAKQWGTTLDHTTRPYQYALQSRAGTDAIVATVRAALVSREDVVVVSLDGRSAYDSFSRAAFLVKLQEVAPELLLPFVRMFYGRLHL